MVRPVVFEMQTAEGMEALFEPQMECAQMASAYSPAAAPKVAGLSPMI
jgi:hypothetical protein